MRTRGKFNGQHREAQSRRTRSRPDAWSLVSIVTLVVAALFSEVIGTSLAFADGLYEVEVPVEGRGPDSEMAGLTTALTEVMTRLTGDPAFGKTAKAESLLKDPHKYVAQYGFRAKDGGGLMLKAQFDQKALEAALRQSGVKFSSQPLPSVLVWLATTAESMDWRFVGSDDTTGYGSELKSAALKRRLPVILPLLDLEDETHVTTDDVVNSRFDTLTTASLRYGTKAMLTGTLKPTSQGQFDGQFNLVLADGQAVPWAQQGSDAQALLRGAIDWTAEYLVKNRLPSRQDANNVEVTVEGITSFENYMRVLRYLRAREQVANVMVKSLETERVVFAARPVSSDSRMTETLPDGVTLESTSETTPSYRLLPGTGPG